LSRLTARVHPYGLRDARFHLRFSFSSVVPTENLSEEQVYVDPPRITALTLAAALALAPAPSNRYLLPAPRLQTAADIDRSIAGKQQTSSMSLALSIDGTDRRTDGKPTVTKKLITQYAASVIIFYRKDALRVINNSVEALKETLYKH